MIKNAQNTSFCTLLSSFVLPLLFLLSAWFTLLLFVLFMCFFNLLFDRLIEFCLVMPVGLPLPSVSVNDANGLLTHCVDDSLA